FLRSFFLITAGSQWLAERACAAEPKNQDGPRSPRALFCPASWPRAKKDHRTFSLRAVRERFIRPCLASEASLPRTGSTFTYSQNHQFLRLFLMRQGLGGLGFPLSFFLDEKGPKNQGGAIVRPLLTFLEKSGEVYKTRPWK